MLRENVVEMKPKNASGPGESTTYEAAPKSKPRPRAKTVSRSAPQVVRVPAGEAEAWHAKLSYSKQGGIHATHANIMTILANAKAWAGIVAWNAFTNEVTLIRRPEWDEDDGAAQPQSGNGPTPWTDDDSVRASAWFARRYGLRADVGMIYQSVATHSKRNEVHPVRAYLASTKWDGVSRVRNLFSGYFGAEATPYAEHVAIYFMVGAVARVMRPGCKNDTMVILEGPQGAKKSSGLERLFGAECFSDSPPDLSSKDRFLGLRGKWCVEWAEIDGFDRADHARIKSFLSSRVDDFRPPYGRGFIRAERQSVFAGTTNAEGYLRDTTGNRRFFGIRCGRVDLDAIARDRDQLWAEAKALFDSGTEWWPSTEMAPVFAAEQEKRVHVDSWENAVLAYVDGKAFVTLEEILLRVFDIEIAKHSQADQNRVARALSKAKWVRKQRRVQKKPTWGYVPQADETVTGDGEVVT